MRDVRDTRGGTDGSYAKVLSMSVPPEPPAYGVLIETVRKEEANLSAREAARRAGISEGWWRQVVKGYQPLSGGGYGIFQGPAETVAKMARVVGLTPERMETEGQRPDVAEKMRKEPPAPSRPEPARRSPCGKRVPFSDMDRALADMARPYYDQIEPRVEVLVAEHGEEGLTGKQVFPHDPERRMIWDCLCSRGRAILPGYSAWETAEAVAVVLASDAARRRMASGRSGIAAGLLRVVRAAPAGQPCPAAVRFCNEIITFHHVYGKRAQTPLS